MQIKGMSEISSSRTSFGDQEPFSISQLYINAAGARAVWQSIIEQYSRKKLTFPAKDKLLALSATAAQAAAKFQDTYVVGVFRKDLLYHMCWERSYDYSEKSRLLSNWIPDTELPSWSWTSFSGMVAFDRLAHFARHGEPLVSVVDIHIDLKDVQNPFGAINSASLIVSGRMFKLENVFLMEQDEEFNDLTMEIAGTTHYAQSQELFWTEEDFLSTKDWLYFLPLFWRSKCRFVSGPPDDDLCGRWDYGVFHTIEDALSESLEGCKELNDLQSLHGLLLVELPDATFERVDLLTNVAAELLWKWGNSTDEHIMLV